ncbi:DNA helicase [Propionibacterium ruminifibrarum]|uniref:DNA 3'-5' helicase n=2 Tax=Propionibacterium ruminifibrarum TaxID=1962131 RepID=A0A375HXT2_9ACTN|nr:DNA helicase [Propionibacterium ruminifibrarum]
MPVVGPKVATMNGQPLDSASASAELDESVLNGLDPEQRQVATTIGGPVAVIAGAGTGKTRAITHRIVHAVLTGQQKASAILAVTFTTRAAGEMRARLRALGAPRVQARTFHSAALRQIRYFWPRVTGTELPEVAGSTFGLVAEAASRERLGTDTALIRDLTGEISWAKSTNVLPVDYAALATRAGRAVAGVAPETVGRVAAEYERVKSRRGVMDYDDILLCAVALMHEHPEVAQEFRSGYQHFVVDEFQDVSPLQHSLLTQWLGDGQDICVVGDPDQAIHSFAGADPRFLTRFAREFPGATVLHLDRNYRSTPQIIKVANDLLHPPRRAAVGQGVVLRPMRPAGPAVETVCSSDQDEEASMLSAWLVDRHRRGTPWSEMAVLYRVNSQSPVLEAALAQARVPYQVRGAERFYDRAEVRAALAGLHAAAESDPAAPALEAVDEVLGALGWSPEPPAGQGRVRERWESWQALHDQVAELTEQHPASLGQAVADLDQRAADQQAPVADGVTLSTLHSAKGLEWDAVALVGVQEGLLPFSLARTTRQIAEERRLFYVGLTRARRDLRLSWATGATGHRGRRRASRFLGGLVEPTGGVDEEAAPGARTRRRGVARCMVCGRALSTGAEMKLGHHADCEVPFDENLFERLRTWRLAVAKRQSVPAFVVFTDATLMALAQDAPLSEHDLLQIRGVGRAKVRRYGEDVLAILKGADVDDVLASADADG